MKKQLTEWKVESSSTALGDSGDYMCSLWITNGIIELSADPDKVEDDELQEICDILNDKAKILICQQ